MTSDQQTPETITEDKRQQFADIFAMFVETYLVTPSGQRQITLYQQGRQQGRRNFHDVIAAAERGEDITDLVLLKLLPYANTAGNRARRVWVTVAPAITKDIKTWLEAKALKQPADWPEVAREIFRFVRRCNDKPAQLEAACRDFAASPLSKGFQTGMLTPILNALRPNHFFLINSKSRRAINYFADTGFTPSLTDYAAANATAHRLIDELAAEMHRPGVPEIRHSDLFDMVAHWLVAVRKFDFSTVESVLERELEPATAITRYWKIEPGQEAWDECRAGGFIAIGPDELGDLSHLSRAEFKARRAALLAAESEWTPGNLDLVWKFAHAVREGDRIVANRGTEEVLDTGIVTGAYYFVAEARHGHRLPVEWDHAAGPRPVHEPRWQRPLMEIDRTGFEAICNIAPAPPRHPPYSLEQCAADTGFEAASLARWVCAVERKGQAILYGPPGTGKTYLAEHLARHLISGGDGLQEIVQFHPAYAYEDFMQGIRPQPRAGKSLHYPLVPGRFLKFCHTAQACRNRCVLIIDEINRADLARVFGELMYLLEYRNREIPLAGGGSFRIPANVRIIGTMNTADRSIALVDHALRRRFAFIKIAPDFDVLRRYHQKTGFPVEKLVALLQNLNTAIGDPHYAVGITFFLRERLADEIEPIWSLEIEPYLEEYFFDQPEKVESFRWERVRQALAP